MSAETRERVVTPDQYAKGYLDRRGPVAYWRPWIRIRRLPDGNYLVADPQEGIEGADE